MIRLHTWLNRTGCAILSAVALLGALSWPDPSAAQVIQFPAKFLVDDMIDASDINPGDGQCAAVTIIFRGIPTIRCTLRAAIQEANALYANNPNSFIPPIEVPAGRYQLKDQLVITGQNVGIWGLARIRPLSMATTKVAYSTFIHAPPWKYMAWRLRMGGQANRRSSPRTFMAAASTIMAGSG